MNEVIFFLLESSVLLAFFYLVYFFLLRKEASFVFNRYYLLGALILAFVLPLLSFDFQPSTDSLVDKPATQLSQVRENYQDALLEWTYQPVDPFGGLEIRQEKKPISLIWQVLAVIYLVGVIVFISRLLWMIVWIRKLSAACPSQVMKGVRIVKVPYQIAPFSFLNSVFVYEPMIDTEDFAQIFDHEFTHVRQRHSLDLLFVQFLATIIWFNPVIWLLLKSLKTTHEYIADRKMITKGYSLVEYQTLLLSQLISNNSFGLVHNFNLSFIKKRITMMKIQKTGHLAKIKVALITVMTIVSGLVIMQCNSNLEKQVQEELSNSIDGINLPTIEASGYEFHTSVSNSIEVVIKDDELSVNGESIKVEDIASLEGDFTLKTPVIMRIDENQKMGLVHEVQEEFRKLNLRVIVYEGQTTDGTIEQVPLQLPPAPGSNSRFQVPELTDEFIKSNNIDLLRLHLGASIKISSSVIDIHVMKKNIEKGNSNYVVLGNYKDSDNYGNYLVNLQSIKQGFYDIYDERAQELFEKSFYDINREQKTSDEAKQQYKEVRKGIPMSIVVELN